METLTKKQPFSKPFTPRGSFELLVKGNGAFTVQRLLGEEWEPATNEDGVEHTFSGNGILFNAAISTGSLAIKYRISAAPSRGDIQCLVRA